MGANLTIAAVRSGTEPVGRLPEGAFHRWLETPLACPKCDVTYNLAVEWEQANGRWFERESRRPIQMLQNAILMGHGTGHRVSHFESAGVVVVSFTGAQDQTKA